MFQSWTHVLTLCFTGLASFTGMLFLRYGADLTPILQYVVHQLHNGQTTEIIVFREIIWKMAGIEPLPSLSDAQVAAMAGGPTLRIEAVASATRGARSDSADVTFKALPRLGKALLESSLALPLLVQVAQQRQACVYQAPNAYLKSLASLFDTVGGASVHMRAVFLTSICRPMESSCNTLSCLTPQLSSPQRTTRRRSFLLSQNFMRNTASVRLSACRYTGLFSTVPCWYVQVCIRFTPY